MSLKTVCQNPYGDVCVSSVDENERVRIKMAHTLAKGIRFPKTLKNGNLQEAFPDIEKSSVRSKLPGHLKVNTNTRTIFHNDAQKYNPAGATIAEHANSALFQSNGCKLSGHKGMNRMAPKDPRQQHCKSPHRAEVGPGAYREDPLWDHTCGIAEYAPDESHHMLRFSKDPARASPAFKSPKRYEQHIDKVNESITSGMAFIPQDFKSWTSRGFSQSRQPRVIEAERWGKTVRDVRPKVEDRPQGDYDPQVTGDGFANSTSAYLLDRDSLRYKAQFESGMPRLVALADGQHGDARITQKAHERLCTTPSHIGPGSYSLEPPRFRSFHSAYDGMSNYVSLASRAAVVHAPTRMRQSSPESHPVTVPMREFPSKYNSEPGKDSVPQAAQAGDLDWMVHQMLASGMADKRMHIGVEDLYCQVDAARPQTTMERLGYSFQAAEANQDEEYAAMVYSSAPSTPVAPYPPVRNGGRFAKLGFLRRSTSYKSLIKSSMQVASDLKESRAAARRVPQY